MSMCVPGCGCEDCNRKPDRYYREFALDCVRDERLRQDKKWGKQSRSPLEWLAILAEEFGEVATEVNEMHFCRKDSKNYRTECIQVAAVALHMVECLDRQNKEGK